jgi:dinuclear metal center YbgI/SA1388 family protein
MAVRPEEVYRALDARYPFRTAEDWDNSGWQVRTSRPIERSLVALDPSSAAVAEAVARQADLLITHHPLFFPHLRALDPDTPAGGVVRSLLEHNLGLLSLHTPFDLRLDGTSGALAARLGLQEVRLLQPAGEEVFYKLAVFVPSDQAAGLREALAAAGAGRIGDYEACSFITPGTGSYRPLAGADPYQGEIGRLEEAAEVRLEMRVPEGVLDGVLTAMRAVHPYDEVAFDLYRTHRQEDGLGLGAVGEWPEPLGLDDALVRIKEALGGVPLLVSGPGGTSVEVRSGRRTEKDTGAGGGGGRGGQRISRVAVMAGSAGDLIPAAAAAGAELFVGGDLKYHARLEADPRMVCVDPGHRATEQPGVERLAGVLREAVGGGEGGPDGTMTVDVFLEEPGHIRVV